MHVIVELQKHILVGFRLLIAVTESERKRAVFNYVCFHVDLVVLMKRNQLICVEQVDFSHYQNLIRLSIVICLTCYNSCSIIYSIINFRILDKRNLFSELCTSSTEQFNLILERKHSFLVITFIAGRNYF